MRAGNFFAGAKKLPRNTFSRVEALFAESTFLSLAPNARIPARFCRFGFLGVF
jgi:hypothetical protein